MTTYARIVGGFATDVTKTDPTTIYHADVASQFVTVPDPTQNGDQYDGKNWSRPTPVVAPTVLPSMPAFTFYQAFTVQERIKIKTSADPIVKEFWDTYERAESTNTQINPNLGSVTGGLAYLQSLGILANSGRVTDILSGKPQ